MNAVEQIAQAFPMRIVAVDFETTGLVPAYDSPTSLDAVVFEDGEPTGEVFSRKLIPSLNSKFSLKSIAVQVGEDCFSVDKLAESLLKVFPPDAISARQAMIELAEWVNETGVTFTPVVAQRAYFDWGFYGQWLASNTTAYKRGLSPVWICTKTMARLLDPKSKDMGLSALAAVYGIEMDRTAGHDSQIDALVCGKVYYRLRQDLLEKAEAAQI